MRTSSFFSYNGPGRISIARFAPRGTPAGYRIFKTLAPGSWFNSVTKKVYERLFAKEILKPLDPRAVYDELHVLAAGAEPVLLCWEKAPLTDTNWCHRRLVASWFQDKLGIDVPELDVQPELPSQPDELKRELLDTIAPIKAEVLADLRK